MKDATIKPTIIASPPIRGVGVVWTVWTADKSLRVADLTLAFENHNIIIKHADPEIKKLIANNWIRKSENIKSHHVSVSLKTGVDTESFSIIF